MNWFTVENEIKYRKMELEKEMQKKTTGKGIDGSTRQKSSFMRKRIIEMAQGLFGKQCKGDS